MYTLKQGDCLEVMKEIPAGSVDMVLADLPYGRTRNDWDTLIPFEPLWEQLNRITKQNAAILIFAQLPFGIDLINSNRRNFRYEIVWHKTMPVGFLNARRMPLRAHENIMVFYRKLPVYNPQMQPGEPYDVGVRSANHCSNYDAFGVCRGKNESGDRYPVDVIAFKNPNGGSEHKHPTQKPVPLLEYLIKTYTNPGETVLDPVMGSGSTGVACLKTGRDFIGIEKDPHYFEIAQNRIQEAAEKAKEAGE